MAKYIQNTYRSSITLPIGDREFIFDNYKTDVMTGILLSDGITKVEDADMEILNNTNSFKQLVKDGMIVILDSAPITANTVESAMELRDENQQLKASLIAMQAELEKLKKGKKVNAPKVEAKPVEKVEEE